MVNHQLATEVGLLFKPFDKELVGTAVELPVDVADGLAEGVLPVFGKLHREAMKGTAVQTDEKALHDLAGEELEGFVFL